MPTLTKKSARQIADSEKKTRKREPVKWRNKAIERGKRITELEQLLAAKTAEAAQLADANRQMDITIDTQRGDLLRQSREIMSLTSQLRQAQNKLPLYHVADQLYQTINHGNRGDLQLFRLLSSAVGDYHVDVVDDDPDTYIEYTIPITLSDRRVTIRVENNAEHRLIQIDVERRGHMPYSYCFREGKNPPFNPAKAIAEGFMDAARAAGFDVVMEI